MPEVDCLAARTRLRRPFRFAALLASCLVAAVLAGSPALAASSTPTPSAPAPSQTSGSGKGEVTFGVQPASASNGKLAPDVRPYFYYGVSAGAALTDHVAILNYSTKPLVLTVYAADALNAVDGGFGLQPVDKTPVDAGAWVSLGGPRLQVRVPARSVNKAGQQVVGSVLLPLKVSIPKGANPGDHVGGLIASLDTVSSDKDGNRVRLEQRVAARLFIRVAGPLHPSLVVQNLRVSPHGSAMAFSGGTATVSYLVRNTGNVKLGGRQRVTIGGLFGLHGKSPAIPDIPLLLPGNSAQVSVVVSHLTPQFRMTATVEVVALQLPGDSNPMVPRAKASVHFWAVPWLVLIIVVLLLALGGYLYNRRRRPGKGGPGGGDNRALQPLGGPQPDGDPTEPDDAPRGKHSLLARSALRLGAAGTTLLAGLILAPAAHAAELPYHDPAVTGQIGLCDKAGHLVTSGNINDRPFVWRAVGSSAAPADYAGAGRKASLLIYQPRPGVAAAQWSGDQMTATSDYTNPKVPMSQATGQDFTLKEYLGEFKPMVEGLLQLRLYFGIPGRATWNSSYPATDIRITGNNWQVVDPASVSCTDGNSTSPELNEAVQAPAAQSSAPAPSATSGKVATSASTKPLAGTNRTTAGPTATPASSAKASGPVSSTAAASAKSPHHSSAWPAIGLLVLILAIIGAGGLWWRNRLSA